MFIIPWLKNKRFSLFILGTIFVALYTLVISGIATCVQHFTLRLILYHNGFIPWNYASFLNYATERILLQKVGGGYIFTHRLLLEHFSKMELDNQ